MLLSADVQAWVAPRLRRDERQRCHFEDLLLGRELVSRHELRLANLNSLLAEPNVFARHVWRGVHAPLAHWIRGEMSFKRVVDQFRRAERIAPPTPPPALRCAPWRDSFPRLREFPCCHNWSLCASAEAEHEWARLRGIYAAASATRP